jgi:hypothetical protein
MLSRLSRGVRRHGAGGAGAIALGVLIVAAGKQLDRLLRRRSGRDDRIAAAANALLDRGRASLSSQNRRGFAAYTLEEATKSLRASSRYCYERRATLWLHRHFVAAIVRPPFFAGPVTIAAAAIVSARPRVLAVGCRDELELLRLADVMPAAAIVGLDLFSWHPRIVRGDMHALPFGAAEFDVVVASHSLEHALDLEGALSELLRVTAPGGAVAIEVPVKNLELDQPRRHREGLADRWDFGNLRSLRRVCSAATTTTLTELFSRDASAHSRKVQLVVRLDAPAVPDR